MIEIKVNGETRRVEPGLTLAGLLAELGIEPVHLAIEYNEQFLDEQADLDGVTLEAGDRLEIVRFVGGG